MPFKSKKQLRTCFAREIKEKEAGRGWSWDCLKWLQETPVCNHKGAGMCVRNRDVTPVQTGKRGGKYFYAGGVKVYIPSKTNKSQVQKYH